MTASPRFVIEGHVQGVGFRFATKSIAAGSMSSAPCATCPTVASNSKRHPRTLPNSRRFSRKSLSSVRSLITSNA